MASTYSSLKIELMGVGDQSGTWGDTANTNLGTAIEEAIVGRATADFTSDTNLTITLLNVNTTQVARNYVLNVTSSFGSLTVTRSLIVPTIEKPYVIENNTTGGQSILVKTTAGTGVTVPTGKKAMVYTNGTDVVALFDWMPALALTTALPITSGGTGQITANAALNALLPAQTSGRVLGSDGANTSFVTSVSSIAVSGGATGMSFGGSPITSSGTVTMTGTLATANGGTGVAASGAAGNILASNGTVWGSVTLAAAGVAGLTDTQTFLGFNAFGAANPYPTLWNVYVESFGANPGLTTYSSTSGGTAQLVISNSAAAALLKFRYGTPTSNIDVGSITTNGTTTAYTTTSDYRMKSDVVPLTNALYRLALLKPSRFKWVSRPNDDHTDGFIAHEVAEVVPEAVVGQKDGLYSDGHIKPQGMDAAKLVPLLVAAVQEQQKLIASLTQRITTLER